MKTKKGNITKHQPMRTCIACRQVKSKRELIRLVRVSSGIVEVDSSGKKAGRGAYLCPEPMCWQAGLATSRLEHTLRTTLSQRNKEQLIEYRKNLVGGLASG